MRRSVLAAAAAFGLVTASAPAAPVPEEAKAPVPYFPTTVGAKWTHQSSKGDVFTRYVQAVERKEATSLVTVWEDRHGRRKPLAKIEVTTGGLRWVEQPVLPAPFAAPEDYEWAVAKTHLLDLRTPVGQRWEAFPGVTRLAWCVADREQAVAVPAGEFMAVPVTITHELGGGNAVTVRHWYARGVGPVKSAMPEEEVVLKEFSPGRR